MSDALPSESLHQARILRKAVINAAEQLGLNNDRLQRVLGIPLAIDNECGGIEGEEKELGLLLIRCHQALYALMGGNIEQLKHFMHTHNSLSGGIPAEQIETRENLIAIVTMLEALRGRA